VSYTRLRKQGGKIVSQDELDFDAWAAQQPSLTSCFWCPWTFTGSVEEGTVAFAAHRGEAHADMPLRKSKRRKH
jgi:homospermidine synthase